MQSLLYGLFGESPWNSESVQIPYKIINDSLWAKLTCFPYNNIYIICYHYRGHTWKTSPKLLWESHFMSIVPFDWSKTILIISYTHRTVNVFTETRQNKSLVKLGRHCGRNILILFSRMHILLLLGYYSIIKTIFLSNDHTTLLPCFNFNSKPPLSLYCLPSDTKVRKKWMNKNK